MPGCNHCKVVLLPVPGSNHFKVFLLPVPGSNHFKVILLPVPGSNHFKVILLPVPESNHFKVILLPVPESNLLKLSCYMYLDLNSLKPQRNNKEYTGLNENDVDYSLFFYFLSFLILCSWVSQKVFKHMFSLLVINVIAVLMFNSMWSMVMTWWVHKLLRWDWHRHQITLSLYYVVYTNRSVGIRYMKFCMGLDHKYTFVCHMKYFWSVVTWQLCR